MMSKLAWTIIPPVILMLIIIGLWHRLNTVTIERDQAKQEIITLSNDLTTQNAAIHQWQMQAADQVQKLQAAEAKAQRQKKAYQAELKQLNAAKVPVNCQAAMQWGAVEAQRLSQQWRKNN